MEKSVNRTVALAKKINALIKESDYYQEYYQFEQLIKTDAFLKTEEEALKAMQKQIVQATYQEDEQLMEIKKKYHERMIQYDLHPLIANYRMAQALLNQELQYISDYINGALK